MLISINLIFRKSSLKLIGKASLGSLVKEKQIKTMNVILSRVLAYIQLFYYTPNWWTFEISNSQTLLFCASVLIYKGDGETTRRGQCHRKRNVVLLSVFLEIRDKPHQAGPQRNARFWSGSRSRTAIGLGQSLYWSLLRKDRTGLGHSLGLASLNNLGGLMGTEVVPSCLVPGPGMTKNIASRSVLTEPDRGHTALDCLVCMAKSCMLLAELWYF